MSAETSSAHFFYSTLNGPRGFPLALASFFFSPEKAPNLPGDTAVRDMLQSRSPSVPISTAEIAAYLLDASAWLPAAQEAFALLPFRITVHIPGLTQSHSLRFTNAVRFARAMGLLRWCKDCERHTLIFEPDSDICEDCGYRALDSA